jgi:hypothetical protein
MDYAREEFKESGDDASLSFNNVSYTPYVNVIKKAQDVAKEAGLSIETVDFSKDGRWVVTTKNGEQLTEPLSKLFEASLGSDPAIQEVYKTQAYVNRKDYAYSNAAQFNGDKNAAEMKYLEESYTMLKQQNDTRYNQLKSNSSVYDKQIADIEKQMREGKAAPQSEQYLNQLKQNKQINDQVLSRIERDNEILAEKEKTRETEGGFVNPYGDVESLRWKVDNAMASMLMEKDLDEAAEIYAYKDAKQSVEANPYAVNEQKFQFDKALAHLRGGYQLQAAKLRNAGERKNMMDKLMVESGAAQYNPLTGEVETLPGYDDIFTEAVNKGTATDKLNLKVMSVESAKRQTQQAAVPYFQGVLTQLKMYKDAGIIDDSQISQILGYKGKKVSLDQFAKSMGSDADSQYKFIRGTLGTKDLSGISKRFDTWVSQNSQLDAVSKNLPTFKALSNSMNDYLSYLNEDQKWRKESSKVVEQQLESQGHKFAKYLYDENGNIRSEADFYKIIGGGKEKPVVKQAPSNRPYKKFEDIPAWQRILSGGSAAGMQGAGNIAMSAKDVDYSDRGIYTDLVKAAAGAYADTQSIKAPPGISTMGEMSGTGVFTPGIQSILVSPKAIHTKGMAYFREFARDVNGMDFGDNSKYQVSFNGATKTAMDLVKDGDEEGLNSIGERLIKDILTSTNYSKTKIAPFKLSAQAIAGGDPRKSAMIITPDREWLDAYVSTSKEGGDNLLSKEQYNQILQNGITVIADNKAFNNTLLTSTYQDPLQMYVDRNPEGYKYVDPTGYGTWTVQKNPFGTSEYITTLDYKLYDPETGKMTSKVVSELGNYGNKLSQQRDAISYNFFSELSNYNINAYNGGR